MSRRIRTGTLAAGLRHGLSAAGVPILVILGALCAANVCLGGGEVETRLKAAYIYNFARFVEWPARAGQGPVRIGVLGQGELTSPLEEVIRGKVANGRSIEVVRLSGVPDSDCCEILLIEHSESKRTREIIQAFAGKPVLTVSDSGDGLRDGAMIAFQIVDESVRFQIDRDTAERAGLKISSQLLKVALPGGKHR